MTAIPHIVPTPRDTDVTYNGEKHFEAVVYLGDDAWDEELQTVPPAPIRDAAIETDADRVIVHFLQPHTPYIGETRLEELTYGQLAAPGENVPIEELLEEAPGDILHQAYYDNLARVWSEGVQPLLKTYEDRRVVVTADHGELLGENDTYGHGKMAAPGLSCLGLRCQPTRRQRFRGLRTPSCYRGSSLTISPDTERAHLTMRVPVPLLFRVDSEVPVVRCG